MQMFKATMPKDVILKAELPSTPLAINGNPVEIQRVLINLLSNALKFTEKGFVTARLAPNWGEGHIDLEVTDTGIGILPSDFERIFREFEQLDSGIARGAEGTGLGLALSRKMARLMGGDILVASIRGRGSTFTLRLPCGGEEK